MINFEISGNIVDVCQQTIFPGTISVEEGYITKITREPDKHYKEYILPGFIDAHVHIESSMLVPTEFARLAVVHGTVAAVSDPHEIANVLGLAGVHFMVANGDKTPFKIAFGAPSCVPATSYETAGAKLTPTDIRLLFEQKEVSYLSEMMNVPGVLTKEPEVMDKIQLAHQLGFPIDGHAPGLRGEEADRYGSVGISTDHECLTLAEAKDKLQVGIKILIREGSAAKNFAALHPLIEDNYQQCMFCSDDKHPDDLVKGHINELVKRSLELGYDLMKVLQMACVNPVLHYNLPVGLLRTQDPADFIVVNNLQDFAVQKTYCQGVLVAESGKSLFPSVKIEPLNNFATSPKQVTDFELPAESSTVRVIEAVDGQLTTTELHLPALIKDGMIISDLERDILKIAVVNRYQDTKPAVALVKNFGLKRGAIASSVAHDSHNIVAVGTTDAEICAAVNQIILQRGGIAVAEGDSVAILPLPVAGLMSGEDGYKIAQKYADLDRYAKKLGSTLTAPFMTLSFMALLVIPELKLSDRGLFSSQVFDFVSVYAE